VTHCWLRWGDFDSAAPDEAVVMSCMNGKCLSLCGNTINVCGMRYMSGHEEAATEAETVFRAVKKMFNDMKKIEYDSVKRMVEHLRACMEELFQMVPIKYGNSETWAAKMDWLSNASYYMEFVTDELNECYAEYEAENSCDLPFDLYEGFVDLLDQCRSWMRTWMKDEPGWEEAGMELGPVRRVTEEEYEGRGRVRAEVRGHGPERGSGVEKEREMIEALRNEISELNERVEKLERVKVKKPWYRQWGKQETNVGSSNNVHEVDTKTLLCRLNEMNF
jgi:hypothetical protein